MCIRDSPDTLTYAGTMTAEMYDPKAEKDVGCTGNVDIVLTYATQNFSGTAVCDFDGTHQTAYNMDLNLSGAVNKDGVNVFGLFEGNITFGEMEGTYSQESGFSFPIEEYIYDKDGPTELYFTGTITAEPVK